MTRAATVTRVIYIGGYGHSGSTLLEYLMAGSPSVLACGEVVSAIREGPENRRQKKCSCGHLPNDCPVWGFFHTSGAEAQWNHAEVLHALMQRIDGQYSAIIDSSKTAWGCFSAPFRLRRRFGSDFMLVHIIRQPAAVSWSVLRKKIRRSKRERRRPNQNSLLCASTVAAWSLANLSCEIFGLVHSRQYVRLRYEDLVRAPEEVLRGLFDKILPGLGWSFTDATTRDNRHQLYGNSVKHHQLTIADVSEDLKWQSDMPPEYSRMVLTLSSLLRWRYGY